MMYAFNLNGCSEALRIVVESERVSYVAWRTDSHAEPCLISDVQSRPVPMIGNISLRP